MPSAGAPRCRTGFENAHGTVFREVLYPWHPWCGRQVAVHEAITRADGVAFRCTLTGSGGDRWLEVPAWMFARATCPDQARPTAEPFVSLTAFLHWANCCGRLPRVRRIRARQASLTIRFGERTMAATASTNSGKHRRTCTQGRRGPMQQTELFGDERPGALVGHPGMAGPAGGHASRADQPDGTADYRPRRNAPGRPSGGGRP